MGGKRGRERKEEEDGICSAFLPPNIFNRRRDMKINGGDQRFPLMQSLSLGIVRTKFIRRKYCRGWLTRVARLLGYFGGDGMIVSAPAPRINFPLIDSAEYRFDSSSLSRPTSLLAGAKGLKADIEIPAKRPKVFFLCCKYCTKRAQAGKIGGVDFGARF